MGTGTVESDTINSTLRRGHDAILLPIMLVAPFLPVTRITLREFRSCEAEVSR